jgi:hypothetical protein
VFLNVSGYKVDEKLIQPLYGTYPVYTHFNTTDTSQAYLSSAFSLFEDEYGRGGLVLDPTFGFEPVSLPLTTCWCLSVRQLPDNYPSFVLDSLGKDHAD